MNITYDAAAVFNGEASSARKASGQISIVRVLAVYKPSTYEKDGRKVQMSTTPVFIQFQGSINLDSFTNDQIAYVCHGNNYVPVQMQGNNAFCIPGGVRMPVSFSTGGVKKPGPFPLAVDFMYGCRVVIDIPNEMANKFRHMHKPLVGLYGITCRAKPCSEKGLAYQVQCAVKNGSTTITGVDVTIAGKLIGLTDTDGNPLFPMYTGDMLVEHDLGNGVFPVCTELDSATVDSVIQDKKGGKGGFWFDIAAGPDIARLLNMNTGLEYCFLSAPPDKSEMVITRKDNTQLFMAKETQVYAAPVTAFDDAGEKVRCYSIVLVGLVIFSRPLCNMLGVIEKPVLFPNYRTTLPMLLRAPGTFISGAAVLSLHDRASNIVGDYILPDGDKNIDRIMRCYKDQTAAPESTRTEKNGVAFQSEYICHKPTTNLNRACRMVGLAVPPECAAAVVATQNFDNVTLGDSAASVDPTAFYKQHNALCATAYPKAVAGDDAQWRIIVPLDTSKPNHVALANLLLTHCGRETVIGAAILGISSFKDMQPVTDRYLTDDLRTALEASFVAIETASKENEMINRDAASPEMPSEEVDVFRALRYAFAVDKESFDSKSAVEVTLDVIGSWMTYFMKNEGYANLANTILVYKLAPPEVYMHTRRSLYKYIVDISRSPREPDMEWAQEYVDIPPVGPDHLSTYERMVDTGVYNLGKFEEAIRSETGGLKVAPPREFPRAKGTKRASVDPSDEERSVPAQPLPPNTA